MKIFNLILTFGDLETRDLDFFQRAPGIEDLYCISSHGSKDFVVECFLASWENLQVRGPVKKTRFLPNPPFY